MDRREFYEQLRAVNPWLPAIERVSMDRLILEWESGMVCPTLEIQVIVEVPPAGFTTT